MDKLLPGEQVYDLQYKGLKIIQSDRFFRFGTDAVLLAGFARVRAGARVCDFCAGTGVIPLLIAGRTRAKTIAGIELEREVCEMARRSVAMNGLKERIEIFCGDVADAASVCAKNEFDVVTCNPPYGRAGNMISRDPHLARARHETALTLEDAAASASRLLISQGRLCMVHQADRIADVILAMDRNGITPKRIRMVHPFAGRRPNLLLIEGVKQGRPGVAFEPPLVVYASDGKYTPEMNEIYHIHEY